MSSEYWRASDRRRGGVARAAVRRDLVTLSTCSSSSSTIRYCYGSVKLEIYLSSISCTSEMRWSRLKLIDRRLPNLSNQEVPDNPALPSLEGRQHQPNHDHDRSATPRRLCSWLLLHHATSFPGRSDDSLMPINPAFCMLRVTSLRIRRTQHGRDGRGAFYSTGPDIITPSPPSPC